MQYMYMYLAGNNHILLAVLHSHPGVIIGVQSALRVAVFVANADINIIPLPLEHQIDALVLMVVFELDEKVFPLATTP